MRLDRRRLLRSAVGGLSLRALATGLPASFLTSRTTEASPDTAANYLILAMSDRGDPVNANAPGSYVDGVVNNPLPEMAPVDFDLGPVRTRAARPWSELSAALRSRMAFLHMQTGVVTHSELDDVLQLRGAVAGTNGVRAELLPSMLADEASPRLGTILREPIPLGRESLSAAGLPLDRISPAELKSLFSGNQADLASLATLRDQTLDELYAGLRQTGTQQQLRFLDRFAKGRGQARQLGEQLGDLLERISDNPLLPEDEARDEILAAVALIQLNVTPVVTIHIPFGNDNHQDADLGDESDEHQIGVGLIQRLWDELVSAQLEERATFAMINVFGRTLRRNGGGGRDHNQVHHVLPAFGPRVRPGVYGGIVQDGADLEASAIDPATGRAEPDGTIPADETLLAAGHALVDWMCLPREVAERRLQGGRPIEGILS